MKKIEQNAIKKSYRQKILATSIAAIYTGLVASSVAQASDIDIYQEAKSGDITLMFVLDISGSMGNSDSGTTGSRIQRLKIAMTDLLQGNTTKKILPISDDKVIGISTLGAKYNNNNYNTGAVLVPARRLDCVYGAVGCFNMPNNGKTHRQILIDQVNSLTASTNTPTSRSYSEAIAYLMGETTSGTTGSGYAYSDDTTKNAATNKYQKPASLVQTDAIKKCSGQGVYILTDGDPVNDSSPRALMKKALGAYGNAFTCTDNSTWACSHQLAETLLDPTKNPVNLKIKTAMVGFGNSFNSVPSFDKAKTRAENLAAVDASNASTNQKNAAKLGIIGEGGWYSGKSSEDIVNSVNAFLGDLGVAIPTVTTGSPSVPQDALNPSVIQNFAYYPQFQPTPEKSFQLWAGNLKKYAVIDGVLKDKNKNKILDDDGAIKNNYDLWAASVVDANKESDEFTEGSTKFALRGGVFSQLKLGFSASDNTKEQRKVLTNRDVNSGVWSGGTKLRQVTRADLTNSVYKADNANNSYLMALLGYNVNDLNNPTSTTLNKELRQIGAVMHSSPLLITNKGKIAYDKDVKRLSSEGREDYILFGTTQGVLHVVKAGKQRLENGDIVVGDKNGSGSSDAGGDEVFTFVPNEMIEKQKNAFLKYDSTNGGVNNLYYGIDGPWTAYTEYVVDDNGYLTVGSGKGTQKGRQMVYGGLRMGGNSYYALDLQNMSDPKLKFHIDPEKQKVFYNNSSKSFNQLQHMGQSWSKPAIGWINWKDSTGKTTRKQVMFVGGGYDAKTGTTACNTGTDTTSKNVGYECPKYAPTSSAPAKGAGVYMFDAQNGDLLWWSSASATTSTAVPLASNVSTMINSVVSEIRTVDRDGDELIDNIYFGDLGGQVFRVDLDNKATALGNIVKKPVRLLNLSKTGGMSPRFYDMPAFSLYSDQGDVFALISIGSGNRSKPLQDYASGADYEAVYNVYDKDVANKNLMSLSAYSTQDIIRTNLVAITDEDRKDDTTLKAPYASTKGWYYEYKNCSGSDSCNNYKFQSEKVFGTPIAMNYVLYVTTFDGSRPGISGDCGAGVKGESYLSRLCLPYGQCDKTKFGTEWYGKDEIGVGIHTGTVVSVDDGSGSGTGGGNGGGNGGGTGGSENNYCLSTGARTIYNGMGGNPGEASRICLIPQRWYAKLQ
ncbi:hypothetical protein [Acinetobacter sp. YH12069]|uniref:hypothetical protein n=1 Tax=Acinetobacter sp. YH12069 TaxID=2601065 RepID=UPI0015D2301E|nr:hypothetical protein [Acinetobacter sp. YH12069]